MNVSTVCHSMHIDSHSGGWWYPIIMLKYIKSTQIQFYNDETIYMALFVVESSLIWYAIQMANGSLLFGSNKIKIAKARSMGIKGEQKCLNGFDAHLAKFSFH